MSIEQALAENTAALVANTAILEKLEAGREAAIAQLESKTDKPATRSRKKPEETPAAGAAATGAPDAGNATEVTDDQLRNAATDYIKGAGEDADARKVRAGNIKAITDHFGTKTLVGETGVQEPDQKQQALFYLNRFAAGHGVNFSAEYDFDGDPGQDAAAEAGDSDMDGIG